MVKTDGMNIKTSINLYAALYNPTASLPFIRDNITVSILNAIIAKIKINESGNASLIKNLQKILLIRIFGKTNFHPHTKSAYTNVVKLTIKKINAKPITSKF